MSIPASLVDSTITDNKPDHLTAFSSLILQIDSLTVFLLSSNVHHWLQLPLTNCSYSMQSLSSKAFHGKFWKLLFVLIANSQHTIIIPYTLVTKISLFILTILFSILKKSQFWLSLHVTPTNLPFYASRLA